MRPIEFSILFFFAGAFITHNKTFNLPMLLLTAFLLLSLACLLLFPSMKMGGRKITPNIALIIAHWDIW